MILPNRARAASQSASSCLATGEPVSAKCFSTVSLRNSASSSVSASMATISRLTRSGRTSSRYAMPPDMPAAKLRPVGPSTTALPPVMYSQPWSPTPSTTAVAPELRTQNRSPTTPRTNTSPDVAPYRATLPAMM